MKLVKTKMKPDEDPDEFVFVLGECCDLLEEMGQTLHDQRHDEINLQALPPENERVRTASYERRDFGLDDMWHMVHTMYVNNLPRSVNAKPVLGRGIAMQVAGHTSSDVQCNYCKGFGLVTQDVATLRKELRREPSPGVSNISKSSTCLATEKQDQETRGDGEIQISGDLSIRAPRIAMRTAAPSMVSAVRTPITTTMPLVTSTTRCRSPHTSRRPAPS